MYPVTQLFKDTLKDAHKVVTRAEVLRSGQVIKTLYVNDGNVTIDSNNSLRRSCSVSLVDDTGELTPSSASDLLTPFGNEVKLYRGIRFPDGGEELVPLGVFVMTDVSLSDSGAAVEIEISGYDRAKRIERAQFTQPAQIAANTNYAKAIQDLILFRVPGIQFKPSELGQWYAQTTRVTPLLTFNEQDDPWEKAREMAQSIGRDLYFDADGYCVMPLQPDPTSSPAMWTYADGEDAMLLGASNSWSAEQAFNWIIITGESTSNALPYRGEAKDMDPASPTYIYGPMGAVPWFLADAYVTSDAQAAEAALGILRKVIGTTENVSFPAMVNPAHEGGDIVSIVRAKSKINNLYVLDRITIPMNVDGQMDAATRRQRKA